MGTFKQLQRKSSISSTPAVPTLSLLQPSRPLKPVPAPAAEPAIPVTQAELERAGRLGHSFARIPLFPPASDDARTQGEPLQTDALLSPPQEVNQLQTHIQAARGSGHPLDKQAQQRLEQGLGADLSRVQVHTDREADRLSRSFHALAFTTGPDIFFRSGMYQPSTVQGMHLLAHEATHTVQQAAGPVPGKTISDNVSISDPTDSFEQAAEASAAWLTTERVGSMQHRTAPVRSTRVPTMGHGLIIQRYPPTRAEENELKSQISAHWDKEGKELDAVLKDVSKWCVSHPQALSIVNNYSYQDYLNLKQWVKDKKMTSADIGTKVAQIEKTFEQIRQLELEAKIKTFKTDSKGFLLRQAYDEGIITGFQHRSTYIASSDSENGKQGFSRSFGVSVRVSGANQSADWVIHCHYSSKSNQTIEKAHTKYIAQEFTQEKIRDITNKDARDWLKSVTDPVINHGQNSEVQTLAQL